MLLSNIFLLATATTALATPTQKRDTTELATQTLIQDIRNIDNAVTALTKSVNAFPGTNLATLAVGSVRVLAGTATIHAVNRKGYADALLSPEIDNAQSKRVVDFTVASVGNSIPAGVEALKAKKAAFESAGQVPVVIASLKLLKDDHDTFSAALLAKTNAAPDVAAEGNAVVKKIDDAIQSGIDYFSA